MNRWDEQNAVVGGIDPTGTGAMGVVVSDHIDAEQWNEVVFILQAGTIAATGTVDLAIEDGTASAATGTGTTGWNSGTAKLGSITQLTATDDNKQVIVVVDTVSLSANGTKKLRARLTAGTAVSANSLTIIGSKGRYNPAREHDIASVDEIVRI